MPYSLLRDNVCRTVDGFESIFSLRTVLDLKSDFAQPRFRFSLWVKFGDRVKTFTESKEGEKFNDIDEKNAKGILFSSCQVPLKS